MKNLDYIIVGSGVAGLHTAYRLQQKGKKVLVLEREDFIGGRMSSKKIEGKTVDFGAKFITPFYKNIWALMEKFNLKPKPTHLTKLGIQRQGEIYNFDASKRFELLFFKGISAKAMFRLGLSLLFRFAQSRNLDFYNLQKSLYLDGKSV